MVGPIWVKSVFSFLKANEIENDLSSIDIFIAILVSPGIFITNIYRVGEKHRMMFEFV